MPTEASNIYIPGLNPDNFPNTRIGRFGKGVAGFGPNRGLSWLHKAGMHGAGAKGGWGGVYPGLGLGKEGLLDFASYNAGGGRTLGSMAGNVGGGFRAQARAYGSVAGKASRGALAGSFAMRAIGPAFTVFDTYQGYKTGGIVGGMKGAAGSLASQYAFGVALRAAGALGTPIAIAAGVAAAGYGSYKLLKAGNARMKRVRNMEMGGPINDPYGNSATMRQRSLQALQGSQLNGRSAFGSEAMLLHVPMFR